MSATPTRTTMQVPLLDLKAQYAEIKADVDAGRIPGAVLLLARHGKIAALDAAGFQDRRSQKPMTKDSIFRIASMSKPITSVRP